jgi:DNA-binding SARP family transcriptional activator
VYRGDLSADDPYSAALEDLRNTLRERYTAALDWLGDYYWHEAQDYAKAILMFKQRLVLDEAHEPAHQALIRLYLENGQVTSARQQYAACRESLRTQLGVAPSRATDSLLQLAISMESETAASPSESKPARIARRR